MITFGPIAGNFLSSSLLHVLDSARRLHILFYLYARQAADDFPWRATSPTHPKASIHGPHFLPDSRTRDEGGQLGGGAVCCVEYAEPVAPFVRGHECVQLLLANLRP